MHESHEPARGAQRAATDAMRSNVETIARLEREALRIRPPAERVSDAYVRSMGTMRFLLAHVALVAGWVAVNTGCGGALPVFDPFPFGTLTLVVSTEGVFLAIFVLSSARTACRTRRTGARTSTCR